MYSFDDAVEGFANKWIVHVDDRYIVCEFIECGVASDGFDALAAEFFACVFYVLLGDRVKLGREFDANHSAKRMHGSEDERSSLP